MLNERQRRSLFLFRFESAYCKLFDLVGQITLMRRLRKKLTDSLFRLLILYVHYLDLVVLMILFEVVETFSFLVHAFVSVTSVLVKLQQKQRTYLLCMLLLRLMCR